MTGVELIAKERQEQIGKHSRTIEGDVLENNNGELLMGVKALLNNDGFLFPAKWDMGICTKMLNKGEKDKLVIIGALIAAEIDRLQVLEETTSNTFKRFKLIKLKFNENEVPKYFGWESLPPVKSEHKLISESNFNEELEHWENLRIELKLENPLQHDLIEKQIKKVYSEFDSVSVDIRYQTALKDGIDVTDMVDVRRYKMIDGIRLTPPVFLLVYKNEN